MAQSLGNVDIAGILVMVSNIPTWYATVMHVTGGGGDVSWWAVILLSKLNQMLLGYFEPTFISFVNEQIHFSGWLAYVLARKTSVTVVTTHQVMMLAVSCVLLMSIYKNEEGGTIFTQGGVRRPFPRTETGEFVCYEAIRHGSKEQQTRKTNTTITLSVT